MRRGATPVVLEDAVLVPRSEVERYAAIERKARELVCGPMLDLSGPTLGELRELLQS